MSRSIAHLSIVTMAFLLLATAPVARAAKPMDMSTAYGVMVSQAVRTLGGSFVGCAGLVPGSVPDSAQVACARLPGAMFGYFKMGFHGRLYEYLTRGTLHVAHAWHAVGGLLEVAYRLQGGTLTAVRERAGSTLYGVFEFVGKAAFATTGSPGN